MYIPSLPSLPADSSIFALAPKSTGWSSIIGIVCAICGNILISLALNAQRYAHVRLSHDREEGEEEEKRRQRRHHHQRQQHEQHYGTASTQKDIAEQRAQANAESPTSLTLEESTESSALIPRLEDTKHPSSSTTSTTSSHEPTHPPPKSYLQSPIWWLGITLMTLGETGNFLAYGFAPASIVSPLGVVALISNCLIAPLLLGEKFRWRDALGVIIATAGCVTIVLSASTSNPKLTPEKIWTLITGWEFEVYLGVTGTLMAALGWASNVYGSRSILIDLGLVGLLGGYTALSTKGVASLLSNSIWRVITFPITYLLLVVLVGTALLQIKYVNRALQRFNATMVIPTQFVLFTISVITGSAVLYRDFQRMERGEVGMFVGGCVGTFAGVWCITSGRHEDEEEEGEHEDEVEGEEAIGLVDEEEMQTEVRERRSSLLAAGGSSSSKNPLRRFRTHESDPALPTLLLTPSNAIDDDDNDDTTTAVLADLAPANASAIHTDSLSTLPQQPQQQSRSSQQQPPKMHATTSAPIIPTLHPRPKTPRTKTTSATSPPPTTPVKQFLDPPPVSASRSGMTRHASLVGSLLPLTSPLSGSLSAIVADSLRRGVDRSRRPSGLGRNRSRRTGVGKRRSVGSVGGEDGGGGEEEVEVGSSPSKGLGGRMRRLSVGWGEVFGGKQGKVVREDDEGRG